MGEEHLNAILAVSQDGILVEENEIIIYVNSSYLELFGYSDPAELIGRHISTIIAADDKERLVTYGKSRLTSGRAPTKYEFNGKRRNGSTIEIEASVSLLKHADRNYIITFIRNISERRRYESLITAQKQALEMVVNGAPLDEILTYLAYVVEDQSGGTSVSSILLLDSHGKLRNGASPNLPEEYLSAIDGLTADKEIGTCSAAAALGQTVITPDIAADTKWAAIKHLPLDLGFPAAWSMPIMSRNGAILGTIGTYFRERREPQAFERKVVESLIPTAALAIERKQADEAQVQLGKELEVRVQERTHELRGLVKMLVSIQEDERRRIARDLHDHLGQQMTLLRLKVEDIGKNPTQSDANNRAIEELRTFARKLSSEVDFLAWQFRPAVLDDIGIVAALDKYVRTWSQHYGIVSEFSAKRFLDSRLNSETETNFYRITQEALNNVSKHAYAKNVNVLLESRDGEIVLIIEDDGVGFEAEPQMLADGGLGLTGIRERVLQIGGTLEIESAHEAGATVFVTVPKASALRRNEDDSD